jgi:hypothetical protein
MRLTPAEKVLFGIYFRTGATQVWFISKQRGGFDRRSAQVVILDQDGQTL